MTAPIKLDSKIVEKPWGRRGIDRSGRRREVMLVADVSRGLLTVTMPPECIGRGHRMAMLERFIDAATGLDGVVFGRLDAYVDAWSVGSTAPVASASS